MTPFTMSSSAQFLPDEGPTPLSMQEWTVVQGAVLGQKAANDLVDNYFQALK